MAPASYRSRAGSLRPNEMQGGSKRYRRRNARPVRSDSSSSAWSVAIFSAPARPCRSISTRHRTAVGRSDTPRRPPSPARPSAGAAQPGARRPSVSGKGVGLHRRAHAHQVPVPVGAVDAAHRRPHLVLAGPSGGGGRAPPRGGAVPPGGGHRTGKDNAEIPSRTEILFPLFPLKKKKKKQIKMTANTL